jgi:hypothetical protein
VRTAATCLLATLIACNRSTPQEPPPRVDGDGPPTSVEPVDPTCVVASGRGFSITMADVVDVRYAYLPSPEIGAATRLTVDVWLAEWIATGEIDRLPLRERIKHQQRLALEERGHWSERLREAAAELELQHGPCYVPRTD